ncbi:hypothetical protein TIFTF001_002329 [Ficus carica]|uniref:Uncharacterized protein n=1 Tax=Ficus carica TaxID=3494 RepID=A0AA87Z3R4_FICCA|nr:hypothetical protein TIFTF001_002329 [Ficus carica]
MNQRREAKLVNALALINGGNFAVKDLCRQIQTGFRCISLPLFRSATANDYRVAPTKNGAVSIMGASESALSSSQRPDNEITTVSHRLDVADPILERLKALKISTPILTSPPTEGSLTDILVRKPSSSSAPRTVDPKVLFELFSMYRDYQEEKAKKISKNQEEIENKIEIADALAMKLIQRLNYSVSAMKTTSQNLSEGRCLIIEHCTLFHALQVEIGELKGRLTEVISNCDALCRRIATEGPESLRSSIKPFAVAVATPENGSSSSALQRGIQFQRNPPSETKLD